MEHVFVYGTLKAKQCRGGQWPVSPKCHREGWVHGELYDLGPYPALQLGNDVVLGEIWSFARSDIKAVLSALDEIEVTNQPGLDNEYDRMPLQATTVDGEQLLAYTYIFVDRSQLTAGRRIHPWLEWHGRSVTAWPRRME